MIGRTLADLEHLVHLVGHVDDRHPAGGQPVADDVRETLANSLGVRLDVGSSMAITRASSRRARAISTIWRWATFNVLDGRVRADPRHRAARARPAARRSCSRRSTKSEPLVSGRPRNMFCATVSSGTCWSSWWIMAMPARRASTGVLSVRRSLPVDRDGAGCRASSRPTSSRIKRGLAGAILAQAAHGPPRGGHAATSSLEGLDGREGLGETLEMEAKRRIRHGFGPSRDGRKPAAAGGGRLWGDHAATRITAWGGSLRGLCVLLAERRAHRRPCPCNARHSPS